MTVEELFKAFKAEALDANVDPEEYYNWDSLAFGFAIAKGVGRAMAFHLELNWANMAHGYKTMEQIVQQYNPNMFDD